MIYYIFYELIFTHFKDRWSVIKALNVFQYVTFRTAYAATTALLISLVFGRRMIEGLRSWNIGQQIREEGPQAHMAKRDTPTMGGLLIGCSVIISTLPWYLGSKRSLIESMSGARSLLMISPVIPPCHGIE